MQVFHPCILPDVLVRRIENELPLIDVSCKRNKNTQTKTNNPSHTPALVALTALPKIIF